MGFFGPDSLHNQSYFPVKKYVTLHDASGREGEKKSKSNQKPRKTAVRARRGRTEKLTPLKKKKKTYRRVGLCAALRRVAFAFAWFCGVGLLGSRKRAPTVAAYPIGT